MSAATILAKELKELSKNPNYHITLDNDNIFTWTLGLYIVHPESPWNHAYLVAKMKFPQNYPFAPPEFRFSPPIFHPNVYSDGRLCISILHEAGNILQGEPSSENWSPAQCVESVIVSILSILDDPNILSPANIDASNCWRDKRDAYNERTRAFVKKTAISIPEDFEIPSDELVIGSNKQHDQDEEDEWCFEDDSEDEDQMSYEEDEAEMSEDYGDEDEK